MSRIIEVLKKARVPTGEFEGLGMQGIGIYKKNRGGPNGTTPHPKELYVTACPPAHCYLYYRLDFEIL
jgi:hypothetical protein